VNALAGTVAFPVYTGVHTRATCLGWLLGKSIAAVSRRVLRRVTVTMVVTQDPTEG
jgi:hypothetical protein